MNKQKTGIVKEKYQAYYPNPIKGKKGEIFKVIRTETDPKWKGWWWC